MATASAQLARPGTLIGAMPSRKPELMRVDDVTRLIGRDRATIFRWFRANRLTRHSIHDYEAKVRRAAVDLNEIRERMPNLLPPEDERDG